MYLVVRQLQGITSQGTEMTADEQRDKSAAGACNDSQYTPGCVYMKGYASASVCRHLLFFYDLTPRRLKLQVLSGGKFWLRTGLTSSVHFDGLQRQQNTAVHGEKGQGTSCCVIQWMYSVSLQLCVSMHLSVCVHMFDDL